MRSHDANRSARHLPRDAEGRALPGTAGPLAIAAAVLMGCILPGFIYVLTRVSAHLAHR